MRNHALLTVGVLLIKKEISLKKILKIGNEYLRLLFLYFFPMTHLAASKARGPRYAGARRRQREAPEKNWKTMNAPGIELAPLPVLKLYALPTRL